MKQYNFPSMQPVPVRALSSLTPRDGSSGPMPPPSHKKSSSFTRRIYEHGGPYKDTSLEAATRKKQVFSAHFEKQFGSCDELISEWDELLLDIKTIAVEITTSQHVMAANITQYYASITLQLAFRGYIARQSLCRLKCERVVKAFILFKRYFRKRVRAANHLRKTYHSYHIRQIFRKIIAMHFAAKVVQRAFRNRKKSRLLNIFIKMLGFFKRMRDHVMLFGVRRAVRSIVSITHPEKYGTPPIIVRFLYKTLRKRRMRMLKGPLGKLSFYILSTFYTEGTYFPTNATIDFVRRKVLNSQQSSQSDNLRLSMSKRVTMRTTAVRNSPLRTSKTNFAELTSKTTPPDSPTTPVFSAAHLPSFFHGAYRPKTIWEVYKLIRDLRLIAKLHPEVLDDSTPPSASVLMTLYSNKHMSSRRLRVKLTNSSSNMNTGTDSNKAIAPLPAPTTPKSKGHKQMQKPPQPDNSKQASKQAPKKGKPPTANASPSGSTLRKTASQTGTMEDVEEHTDETDDDTESTHTDSSLGSVVLLKLPSADTNETSKKLGGDSKSKRGTSKDASKAGGKTSKPPDLKRENSITKKQLTKTPSGKGNIPSTTPKSTVQSPSNASASGSPKSTQNNSNQSSASSLLVPPMLGDIGSRQASMKSRADSSRSIGDDSPPQRLSKSRGDSSRSLDADKDKDKAQDKPAPALSARSNSRLNRLQSRANSSSSIKECREEEHEDSGSVASSNVKLRISRASSPMKELIETAMPLIVAEMSKPTEANVVNEGLTESAGEEDKVQEQVRQERAEIVEVLNQLIDNVVLRQSELDNVPRTDGPSTLEIEYSREAESVISSIVTQTLHSLVDRAVQLSCKQPPNRCSSPEEFNRVKRQRGMSFSLVSSVLESSMDSLVFKITGSPPKPRLRLDGVPSSSMESTFSHTFALSDCSSADYNTDTDTPFKHLKDTLSYFPNQFSNPNSPSKLSREQVHALLPISSIVQEQVVSQAVSNLLSLKTGLTVDVGADDSLDNSYDHIQSQEFVPIGEDDDGLDGESVGHVSSVSSVDWDLPDDVIESLLGTDLEDYTSK